MRVIAGVAGKDRGRTLPFPPMWERDGQAPERQEHGPRVQGGPGAWVPGNLGISCSSLLASLLDMILYSTVDFVQRVPAIAPVRLPTYCIMYPFSHAHVQFHRINRGQHWEQLATHGGLAW